MMLPTGLCAHSLAIVSIWPTTWCARMSVAFAAATALVMMATPASAPLIRVPMELAAATRRRLRTTARFLMHKRCPARSLSAVDQGSHGVGSCNVASLEDYGENL